MNKHKSKASSAFSLIELSIVILIVGIIVAGVTQSSRLVRQSKLKSAQSLTQSSPVNSIRSIAAWFETSQDASFPAALDDDAAITQWNDINSQSTNKLYALPGSGGGNSAKIAYEMDGINGLPSINFKASALTAADILAVSSGTTLSQNPIVTTADANSANAFTAFLVYRLADAQTAGTLLYNGKSGTDGWGYSKATNTFRSVILNGVAAALKTGGTTANAATTYAGVLPSVPEIATITFSGGSTGIASLYVNGGNNFSTTFAGNSATTVTTAPVTLATPTLNMYIGGLTGTTAGAAPTAVWKGLVSEIIIFDSALKSQDLRDVTNYLSKKYGITLS